MAAAAERVSHLSRATVLWPEGAEETQEKETYEEAFNRLWSDIGQLTEDEFQARLIELVRIGDEQPEISNCCTTRTCDLCTWLDWLNSSETGAASLDYQGPNEPFPPYSGSCSGYGHSVTQ